MHDPQHVTPELVAAVNAVFDLYVYRNHAIVRKDTYVKIVFPGN